ncbi:MAG: hypothetical protein ABR556_01455 [Pyrinomonadaceae bacterium]
MADGGDIIIRGGSVELEYDDSVYFKVPGNPGKRKKDKNSNKQIRQILVKNNGATEYDSGDHPEGLAFTISVLTK